MKMIASKGDTSSCGIVARFQCLYTKQKSKKRKAWSDGRLDLHANGNCTLYDGYESGKIKAGNALDTIFLTKDEMNTIVTGSETELELENHLVTVESAEGSENTPPPQPKHARRPDRVQTSAHSVHHSTDGLGSHAAHAVTMHSRTTPAPSTESEPAMRGGSIDTINQCFRPPIVVKSSAVLNKPELTKPFKPPVPRTNGAPSSVAAVMTALASRVSTESIQSRYRDCLSGHKVQADDASVSATCVGAASARSNGSYSVSKEEIDDMWASEGEDVAGESGGLRGEDGEIVTRDESLLLECQKLSPGKEQETPATNETDVGDVSDVSADNIWDSPAAPGSPSHPEATPALPAAASVAVEDDIWG